MRCNLAVVRMLQQSSQVYQTMKLETLQQMVPFLEFTQVDYPSELHEGRRCLGAP